MAIKKRKGSKKRTTRRRRRIGAMALNAKSPLVQLGSAAVGYLMADTINGALDKVTGTMDKKIVGVAEAGVGAALVFMKITAKPSLPLTVVGGVLAGAGVKRLLKEFGVINGVGGYQSVPVLGKRAMSRAHLNGYGNVPVLGGYTTAAPGQQLNGVFNGYNVPSVPLHKQIMGCFDGAGINSASGCMD